MQNPEHAFHPSDAAERVIVYGLRDADAQHNSRIGHTHSYNFDTKLFTIVLDGGATVDIRANNLFFVSKAGQYFAKPIDTLPFITEVTRIERRPNGWSVVATEAIPAGTLRGAPSFRVSLTRPEIEVIEHEFERFLRDNLFRLMGRDSAHDTIAFEPHYNPAIVFVGAVAEVMHTSNITSIIEYDPVSRACLEREWRRCNGPDLLWFEFWRRKLAHLAPVDVFALWILVRNSPWPSLDRLSLIFGQTICFMECHPDREKEYSKVMAGQQNADVDNLRDRYLSTFMMTPPDAGDHMKAYFMKDVAPGEHVYTDCGLSYVSDLCDTILNFLYMPRAEGDQWFTLYKTILTNVSPTVARSFLEYVQNNVEPVKLRTIAPDVRTTPSVHLPPGSFSGASPWRPDVCDWCAALLTRPARCSKCHAAAYCNRQCQLVAWKTHKPVCKPAGAK
jgi:hypothetical protein